MRRALCIPSALLAAVTCNDPLSSLLEGDQEYVFEVEYVNFAWGLAWVGIVIDRDGRVHAYDHSHEPWVPSSDRSYTREELESKYASARREVGRVDVRELREQFDRVRDVGNEFDVSATQCADAGGMSYVVFRYDRTDQRYTPVVLREEGNRPRANSAPSAAPVAAWLRELTESLHIPGLSPFAPGSCTP